MDFVTEPGASGFDATSLGAAVAVLDEGLGTLHDGYQLYVSRHGVPVVDTAGGEAQPGVPAATDSIMLWFSSSKPLTAIAVAQLWERGDLALDDPIGRFIPEFAIHGKEAATVRHVLTHRGGFPFADMAQLSTDWDELVEKVCASPAAYPPGTAAGYHPTSGWIVLGELVRRIDGRRIDEYLHDEIFAPLGMVDSYLGIPADDLETVRGRTGHIRATLPEADPAYFLFNMRHMNSDTGLQMISPGASGRGPAHDLARFHEMVLGRGTRDGVRIVSPQTLETFTAVHRFGVVDQVLGIGQPDGRWGSEVPWCLGFVPQSSDYGPHASFRSVGHSGHASSAAFCDPEYGFVIVVVTNGLPGFEVNTDRMERVCGGVYESASAHTPPPVPAIG